MRTSCKYCGRTHEIGAECSKKPKRKNYFRSETNEEADRFRRGNAWRKMSLAIRQRDFSCCRVCLELSNKYGTYGGRIDHTKNLSVHHIIPVAEDFSRRLDDGNLITLCSFHHHMADDGMIEKKDLFELAGNRINFSDTPRGV